MQDLQMLEEDLTISGGDFVVTTSDPQHIDHALKSYKGQFYQFTEIGAGLSAYVNSSGSNLKIKKAILKQVTELGYRPSAVNFKISGEGLEIDIVAKT